MLVDEEKITAANLGNKIFWKLLESSQVHTKAQEAAGPPEEDENYEIEVIFNAAYALGGRVLVIGSQERMMQALKSLR